MNKASACQAIMTAAIIVSVSACGMSGKPMPADYPLPVYPGATAPNDAYREVIGARSLVLDCTDDPAKIAEYYKTELEKGGWEKVKVDQKGDTYVINGFKNVSGDGKKVEAANIQVASKHIILTYMKQ
jgi:hypothetical protein